MLKRVGVLIMVLGLGLALAANASQGTGKISGTVRDVQGQPLANAKLQLRNVDTGQLAATTRASGSGAYEFTGIGPGNFVVEIVDDSGKVVGISPATALAAGGAVAGLVVTVSATGTIAGAAAAGGLGAFFTSTGGILLLVGIGAGVTTAIVLATNEASPSR